MKNKYELKKYIKISLIFTVIFATMFWLLSYIQYHCYTINFNKKINLLIETIKEKYPGISENEIIEVFNNKNNSTKDYLKKYGIDILKDSTIIENRKILTVFAGVNLALAIVSSSILILTFLKYNRRKDIDIEEIENYIEQINRGNYKINIDSNTEDELSILKNEVYKTMIMLKENADNSLADKLSLKSSLEDISHQIKTPLTTIMIAIDNLEDNPDLDIETREKFIKTIKKNTSNINFLIQSILKLSKFDTNTVEFIKSNVKINNIITEALSNTENLCDLKNIKIEFNNNTVDATIYCDKYWQTEAVTNIIKNAIEHATRIVKIDVEENNVYIEISIENDGTEISKKDIPHIFERFYKGENANINSVGIGLSLAKTIINSSNGNISVESKNGKTKFTIKYLR